MDEQTTGAQAVARWARDTPAAIAVIEGQSAYSYATLAADIARAVTMLRSHGLTRGMVIGIESGARYRHLVLILASEVIGAAHLSMTQGELLIDSGLPERCDLLCTDTASPFVARHGNVIGCDPGDTIGAAAVLTEEHPRDTLVRISTTSGTTGQRKFIGHTRRAIGPIMAGLAYNLNNDPEYFNYVAIYRFNQWGTYGKSVLACMYGKTTVYCDDTNFFASIRRFPRCHTMLMVGDAASFAAEARRDGQKYASCVLRVFGAALTPTLRAELEASIGGIVFSNYASNEIADIAIVGADGTGTLSPGVEIRIVDDDGEIVTAGEPGLITVRSPCMTERYLWNDSETKKHFINGWFVSSDMGMLTAEGKLILLGRADDMLNIGGLKVAPYPIEERIKTITGVTDAALIGHANADELHLFVECIDRAAFASTGRAVAAMLKQHVPSITAHYGTALPRTETGKVRRNLLQDHLRERSSI